MGVFREGTRVGDEFVYDRSEAVFSAFKKVVSTYPKEPALVSAAGEISYEQLAARSEKFARALVASGIAKGDRVGIVATRSADTIAAILGVLQAGGVYVPLDPSYAREQLEFIVQDAEPVAVLHMDRFAELSREICLNTLPLIPFQAALESDFPTPKRWPKLRGSAPIYIMYTSGSTGKPKGVVVPHRGVTRLVLGQRFAPFGPGDTSTHSATIAADASTWEIWCALLTGMRLSIVEDEKPSLEDLAAVMRRDKVNVGFFFAGLLHLMIDHQLDVFKTLRVLNTGGDVLSSKHARKMLETNPECEMFNLYGPTENSAVGTFHQVRLEDLDGSPIPIGRPILNSDAFILDDDLKPVAQGTSGQLVLSGDGVALGYLNRPEKTAASFIRDPRKGHKGTVYLTGDLARLDENGVIEFLGRLDRQIKLGGRRIELDEIEHVLRQQPDVEDGIVEAVEGAQGNKRIIGFVAPKSDLDEAALKARVLEGMGQSLASVLLPHVLHILPEFPMTKNDKVDRRALVRFAQAQTSSKPQKQTEDTDIKSEILAVWDEILSCGAVSDDRTFFDVGGTSLQLIDAHALLETRLGVKFDIVTMFETPRLGELAEVLGKIVGKTQTMNAERNRTVAPHETKDIAIIGIAGRYPNVGSIDALWQHLRDGDDLLKPFTDDQLEDAFTTDQRADKAFVPVRPHLKDADKFDAGFFGLYPREADLMDPQARVFLEICWEAFEDAGCDPARDSNSIGVFAGSSSCTYLMNNVLGDREKVERITSEYQVGSFPEVVGNLPDTFATRVAFKLDLKGPAFTVQTACSTSLTAISQACNSILAGDCEMALAGGVSITFPQRRGYFSLEGGMVSPDGHCRPFDADAGGTVFGHGAGVVLLKPLAAALADGDQVYAVIKGCGINNDGADKIAFTAPSVNGQVDAIRKAHSKAGVAPETISFVECHGTATPLGDPIELCALAQAFGDTPEKGSVAIGSTKGNLGHLDAAAGVTSVIKTALMLKAREIPPMANFKAPNPKIDFDNTPFKVPTALNSWQSEGPRRAGVSSFGVGGTNVHVVLEEAPRIEASVDTTAVQILPLSARTPEALDQMKGLLADHLKQTRPALGDAAFTLQEGRAEFDHRQGIACTDLDDAITKLRAKDQSRKALSQPPKIVFMFPGQGSQYPGMGAGLYHTEPEYARWIDQGAEILKPLLDLDINQLLCFGDVSDKDAARALRDTRLTQPALFLTQFANAKLWQARGINPDAMIGHSVGEFTAAALSGVMDFETGLRIIATRGRLMQEQPEGAMLSVRATLADLSGHVLEGVDIAARNAPKLLVLAGPTDRIDAQAETLKAAGIACSVLHTSHAFHSAMMDPVVTALKTEIAGTNLNPPQIPYVSCVTGTWIENEEAQDPAYWAQQARATVNFETAIAAVSRGQGSVLVEVGAGSTLSSFATQTLKREGHGGIVQSMPDHTHSVSDEIAMADAFGRLWAAGMPVDWSKAGPRGQQKLSLPTYPFERKRHWVDAPVPIRGDVSPQTSDFEQLPVQPIPAAISSTGAMMPVTATVDRKIRLTDEVLTLLSDLSGESFTSDDAEASFLELGFDSLFLGQVTQGLSKAYGTDLTFRQLLSEYPSVLALVAHLDTVLPAEEAAVAEAPQPEPVSQQALPVAQPMPVPSAPQPVGQGIEAIIHAQTQAMQAMFAQQLRAVSGQPVQAASTPAPVVAPAPAPVVAKPVLKDAETEAPAKYQIGRGASLAGAEFTPEQQAFIEGLTQRYSAKNPNSKASTAKHRPVHADPRTAAGYRQEWKELVFPIVSDRSKGSRIWDVDGNEYIDIVSGFGQTAFGHAPDFVNEAVARQLEKGYAIGPQSDQAGPVAEKFAKMVGHERVTFCNTGSEAVMAAMRLARAVTGRDLIVVFGNDYHGQFDEVLVKGKKRGGDPSALPIAPGIPRTSLNNMIVLPYDAPESLDWIRENLSKLAAVIVEPVQSRYPELRPAEFVRSLREITQNDDAALVFDEVVTGFRVHPRGMQGIWDIQGDMATYGKVVGGGMPIGMLAGSPKYMDALDGGAWNYGDDSKPEVSPTFFAGTFVRHPLIVAAVDATLDHMAAQGDDLWKVTADRTAALTARMNKALNDRGLPNLIETFSSWYAFNVTGHDPRAALLYPLMREGGVHVLDGYCGFMTTAHTEADFQRIGDVFEGAIDQLQSVGILTGEAEIVRPAAPLAVEAPTKNIPLTEAQREVWMTTQLGDTASCSFNESVSLRFEGALDVAALNDALDAVIARHDGLRMQFARNGESFDIVEPYALAPEFVDCSDTPDPEAKLTALLAKDANTPIDIVTGPPIRGFLVRLSEKSHALVLTAHHIVCDGWSYNVVFDDLSKIYAAKTEGRSADLPAAQSFASFAKSSVGKSERAEVVAYWKQVYSDIPVMPDLPTDRPRTPVRVFDGASTTGFVSAETMKAVRKVGAKQGCTLFSTLFAGLQVVIGRLSGANDVVLGVPTGGQALLENPALVGHCVNFLPIRAAFDPAKPIADHLTSLRDKVMTAFDHQDYTYGTLVRSLDIERSLNRLPLTEVQFNLEKVSDGLVMPGVDVSFEPNPKAATNFDLFFNVIESRDGLRIDVDYNTGLYDEATVQRWIGHFASVLEAMAADANQTIEALTLMSEDALASLVTEPNQTSMEYDATVSIQGLVRKAAEQRPGEIAIEDANGTLTYGALEAQSDALAALLQDAVPGTGSRIGIALERSAGMLVALLAVLKSGHAYVPLDPRHPSSRLRMILEAASVPAVLTDHDELKLACADMDIHWLEADAASGGAPKPVATNPDDTAYVIFTSGSTGTPKGVEIPHRAVVNFLHSMANEPGFTADDALLSVTTVSFDIAVLELFLPLICGGRTVIAPTEDVLDGFKLVERIGKGDITVMQATPTLWGMLLEAGLKPSKGLKMLAGGEPLPRDLAEKLVADGAELWNMYGPTETTIWSAVNRIEAGVEKITIGHPIANTSLHILGAGDMLQPMGVVGELNIGGDGLAKGYFGRDDLTEAAFRNVDLGGKTHRLYRTGDLARRLSDGSIEVLGRSDGQIKLRGFRIELGEIETVIRAVEGVEKAAVDLRENAGGDKQLVGYVVAKPGSDPQPHDLAASLSGKLPGYMVPSAWVMLSELPQTLNGKLNRKALPAPEAAATVTPLRDIKEPASEMERKLAAIWQEVLGIEKIGTGETLFMLGADSLSVFRIAAKMLDEGLNLEGRHLLQHPSVGELAAFAESRSDAPTIARPSLKSFRGGARRGEGKAS